MNTVCTGIGRVISLERGADRLGDVLGLGEQRADEDRDQGIESVPIGQGRDRSAVLCRGRGCDQVHRVGQSGLWCQELAQRVPD